MREAFSRLIKKYNVPGPRYTSYPTVPFWEHTPTSKRWIESLDRSIRHAIQSDTGSAVYIHIPFCKSLCTYCGCNTRITRNQAVSEPYFATVLEELQLYLQALGREKIPVADLHLGGGTPTFPTPEELGSFLTRLLESLSTIGRPEFSVEVDPRVTTSGHLEILARHGFRRISLGVQDFDPKVQEIVHRVQTVEQVRSITEQARKLGYTSVNYDLIYGLPLQNQHSVEETVKKVIELRPDRIAFYGYAHVPWIKPSQRRYTLEDLPTGEEKRKLYETGRGLFENAGYQEIGMDHFALKTDDLWKATIEGRLHRNFMGYVAKDVFPLLGLGVSAISDSWEAFAQNEKLLEKYTQRVKQGEIPLLRGHLLNTEDQTLRRHILNLTTRFETSWESPEMKTGYLDQMPEKIQELIEDGLVELHESRCKITSQGRPFLRNICMAFDARLSRKAPDTQLFSRTI